MGEAAGDQHRPAPSLLRRIVDGWRDVLAGAIGLCGPVSATWNNDEFNRHGAIVLVAFTVAWLIALRVATVHRWVGAATAGATAAAALALVPTIGRTAVLEAFVPAGAAHLALIGRRRPAETRSGPPTASLPAVVVLLGAAWVALHAPGPALPLALAVSSLPLIEAHRRSLPLELVPDRALRRLGRAVWSPLIRLFDASGVRDSGPELVGRARRRGERSVTALRTWWRRPKDRRERSFLAAVAVGVALRFAWAITMTRSDAGGHPFVGDWYSTWNLRIANQVADLQTPSISGRPTAFWPVGYGATLSPIAWLSDATGWISLNFGAALLNAALASLTIVFAALVAQQWLSPSARNPTAWLVALAPGLVFATSVAMPETLMTTLFVFVVWATTHAVRSRTGSALHRSLVGVGLVVGYAMLVGDRCALLVAVPALALRAGAGSWRGTLRATAAVLVGVLAVVVPWGIRNGIEVGWWNPTATSSPEGMCTAKYDYSAYDLTHTANNDLIEIWEDCLANSPLDDASLDLGSDIVPPAWVHRGPDEGAWATRNSRSSLRWFATHPTTILSRAPGRLYDVAGADRNGGYEMATHFGRERLVGERAEKMLSDAANWWYVLVAACTLLALAANHRARSALPLWFIPLGIYVQVVLGPYGFSRHFFTAYPFLAIYAGGFIAAALRSFDAQAPTDDPAA